MIPIPDKFRKTRTPGELLSQRRHLAVYIAKCILGALLVQGVTLVTHDVDPFWTLISVILVLTPDSDQAMPLAITRMKANACGAIAALACLALSPPHFAGIALGFAVAAILCFLWDVMEGSRAALAATLIVMQREPGVHVWDGAVMRVVAVFGGCILGVGLTYVFHRGLAAVERRRFRAAE